jgi:signal transduction histidine kinase
VERHLGVIEKEIANLNELLSDLLTIGRIDVGKITFSPQWTDVLRLAQEVIHTHFAEHQTQDNRTVRLRIDGNAFPVYLDNRLLTHILVNLLSNAFKFSRKDPTLQVTFGEQHLLLTITDEGIGIPADDLSHLFETFFRARNAISIPGSGLGLIIARQFTELHGGSIQVESEENRGTTFTVTLPLSPQPD